VIADLRGIVGEIVGTEPGENQPISDMGLDSLGLAEFADRFAELTGRNLHEDDITTSLEALLGTP
jgi:hypothetical protein